MWSWALILFVYEQVMENTRGLNLRSAALAQGLNQAIRQVKRVKVELVRAAMEKV